MKKHRKKAFSRLVKAESWLNGWYQESWEEIHMSSRSYMTAVKTEMAVAGEAMKLSIKWHAAES
jgi:hypothetical protein